MINPKLTLAQRITDEVQAKPYEHIAGATERQLRWSALDLAPGDTEENLRQDRLLADVTIRIGSAVLPSEQ